VECEISVKIFIEIIKRRQRDVVYTGHSIEKGRLRQFLSEGDQIKVFDADINGKEPFKIIEQGCETQGERKFKAYYQSSLGGFMCYIFVIDGQIRLVSLYRTTKRIQKQIYKYGKQKGLR